MPRVLFPATVFVCLGLLLSCSGPQPDRRAPSQEPGGQVFHVQVLLTEDKQKAEQALSKALSWWKNRPSGERPSLAEVPEASRSPVDIKWKAPLYRVRIGPFASRQEAEAVLAEARSPFPDAFVAPEQVGSP